MKTKKLLLTASALALIGCLSACNKGKEPDKDSFTYKSYTTALASNWNPHTWETNSDDSVLSYLSEGLVSLTVKDSTSGVYQWCYDQAVSVDDVTLDHPEDLVTYCGYSAEEAADYVQAKKDSDLPGQFVYEIKLREGLKWEDGTAINADTFIESGKRLLDPKMLNYRANLYVTGESAIAGAYGYYYSGAEGYFGADTVFSTWEDGLAHSDDLVFSLSGNAPGKVFGAPFVASYMGSYDYSYEDILDYFEAYGGPSAEENKKLEGKTLTEIIASSELKSILEADFDFWCTEPNEELGFFLAFSKLPEQEWSEVGLYKVDDLTFRYVMDMPLEWSQAMVSFSSSWLVHPDLYDSLKKTEGSLTTTTYGTSVASSISYGPYKLTSLEASKQMVLEQNPNWWGWEKDSNGNLVSYTQFDVDGKKQQQYQTTKIVIDVLDEAAAKQKFLSGELSDYTPTASELSEYTLSDALYQVPETYTMSFFFNSDLNVLSALDVSGGNKNSVVLSNKNFRKAMSLAIDRAEFVTATPAYTPAYSLMNDLYFYDVWNDPESSYRHSEPAMKAIVDLYGVSYGPGETYATLKDAYDSINGYNLTEAKGLMKTAFEELKTAGLVEDGAEVYVKIGWAKGALQSDDLAQVALLNKYFAAAIEGSGFSKFQVEGIGNIEDRYSAVPKGEYAIGYGAWGGAAFYPFRNLQVYADPDTYDVNELGCWDPTSEKYLITVDGVDYNLTWQQWSNVFVDYSIAPALYLASNEVKLAITAELERVFLDFYYRIPLCGTTAAFLLGYQVSYYTETYNIMYDFGGFRLMKYNYTDAEWANFVKSQGGTINYK